MRRVAQDAAHVGDDLLMGSEAESRCDHHHGCAAMDLNAGLMSVAPPGQPSVGVHGCATI